MTGVGSPHSQEEVIQIRQALAYKQNSIGTKIYIDHEGTSVTAYAIDTGQVWTHAPSTKHVFVHILEGEVQLKLGNTGLTLVADDGYAIVERSFTLLALKQSKVLVTVL
ncbi:MAG TPA: hypothetical protein VGL38_09430 [bacterium]|jgi:hypothetical protein